MDFYLRLFFLVATLSIASIIVLNYLRNRKIIWAAGDLKSAHYYQSQGDLVNALRFYQKVVTQQPHWPSGHLGTARILLMQSKFKEAIDAAKQAEETIEAIQDRPSIKARQLVSDFRGGTQIYDTEIHQLTNNAGLPREFKAEAAFIKGVANFRLENFVKSVEAYNVSLNHDPAFWQAYLGLAEAHLALGEYSIAAAIGQIRGHQAPNASMAGNLQFVRLTADILQGVDPTEAHELLLRTLAREDYYPSWPGLASVTWDAIRQRHPEHVAAIQEAQTLLTGETPST